MNLEYQQILQKYNKTLHDYANRVFHGFNRYMEHQRKPYHNFLKSIFDFYLFCSYLVDNGLFPDDEKYNPLKVLYAKGTIALYGVYSCLMNGIVSEASISVRSLFETYINTKLILNENTDERLKLFDEYFYVEKWNNYKSNKRLYESGVLDKNTYESTYSAEIIEKIENDYEKVKDNYNPTRPYSWSWKIFKDETGNNNPSISFISKKLNEELDYVKVYGVLSISVHNTSAMINLFTEKESISLAPLFNRSIFHSGVLAADYAAKITELLIDYFEYHNPTELKIYIREFILAIMEKAEK